MKKTTTRRAERRAPAAPKKGGAGASSGLVFELDPKKDGLEPLLGAAYLMMDKAYARLDGSKARLRVTLEPKPGVDAAALKKDFLAELGSQRLRWAVARNNRSVREYVAENALTLAAEFAARSQAAAAAAAPAAEPAGDQLTAEQRAEIERLIAEVETEIQQMNKEQKHADPQGATLSWEAAAEADKGRPAA